MRVHTAFLANHAETHGGLLCVLGGWPEFWSLPEVPSEQTLSLVVVAEVTPAELGHAFTLGLSLSHEGHTELLGELVFCREASPDDMPGGPRYALEVLRLRTTFVDVGPWEILLSHAGAEVARVRFVVRLVSSE